MLRRILAPIRVRLTLWYMLMLALVLALFGAVLYLTLRTSLYANLDGVLRSSTSLLANMLEVNDGSLAVDLDKPLQWNDPKQGESFWRILDPAGRVVAHSVPNDLGSVPILPQAFETGRHGQEHLQTLYVQGEPIRVYTGAIQQGARLVAIVQAGVSLSDVNQTLSTFAWTILLALPLTVLFAGWGGLFLASRALRPVDQITRTAASISARDLSQRLSLDLPSDEIGRLARTFDAMLARLDEAFREQARFVADASHELRTPLTVMRGTISVALSRPRKASDYQQVLQEVEDETERMSRLVEQLLALARADTGHLSVQRQRVELSGLLADLADHASTLAEPKGLAVFAQIAQGLEANTDPDLLTQIVLNLLDNAIKYTPSGAIYLSAEAIESYLIQITVADTGPGIPQEHLARIFQRFYRVDTARSRDVGGAGLGLALAREYARLLGGDLTVASAPGDGATFTLTLPMAQSD